MFSAAMEFLSHTIFRTFLDEDMTMDNMVKRIDLNTIYFGLKTRFQQPNDGHVSKFFAFIFSAMSPLLKVWIVRSH